MGNVGKYTSPMDPQGLKELDVVFVDMESIKSIE